MELIVKGHSGYDIDIVREGTDLYVYKHCQDAKKAERLLLQAAKQQQAIQREHSGFRIPAILDVAHSGNGASVKMDYIYARNFMEYFESAGFEQITYFIATIKRFVEEELALSPIQVVPAELIRNKWQSVERTIMANPNIPKTEELKKLLSHAGKVITDITEWRLPVGVCHGDLTLSNILFTANTYYLIDFLDSFAESPLLDVVKLRQDTAHYWSPLLYTKPYDPIRLQIICRKIDDDLDRYFRQYSWYTEYYLPMQVLNLLRVMQYAKEEPIIQHLQTELSRLLYAV